MTMSRRGFLQVAGITLAASQLGAFAPLAALAEDSPVRGRVLAQVSVGGKALWPDSVVRILDADAERYRLADGWAPRSAIQPMFLDASASQVWQPQPVYAEVCAPVAPVWQSASVTAPLLARIGHGGVLGVRKLLRDASGQVEWVGVSHQKEIGWVQANRVQPLWTRVRSRLLFEPFPDTRSVDRLQVSRARQILIAFSGDEAALTTPISTTTSERLEPGRWLLESALPNGAWTLDSQLLAWPLYAGQGLVLGGVHWHNAFGAPQPGPHVQLPIAVVRWLYTVLHNTTTLEIV